MLSARAGRLSTSAIRDILKVVGRPGMISMAGGIPAPDSIPVDIVRRLVPAALDRYGTTVLQYDRTEGFIPLLEALREYLASLDIAVSVEDIVVTAGAQSALDLVGRVMISEGDVVAVESPTYLGAIQAFGAYDAHLVEIECDDHGPIPERLDRLLRHRHVKLIYLIPNFQNPSGRTLSAARRMRIAELIRRYRVLLLEDDPYRELRYRGEALPTIKSLAPEQVIYVGSFSKILCPGLRVGYAAAPSPVVRYMVKAKQAADLHTGTLSQALAALYMEQGHMAAHLPVIRNLYRARCRAMLNALAAYMPEGYRWSAPDGGMFIWGEAPGGVDMSRINEAVIERGTVFVPGQYFFVRPERGRHTFRLNFTMPTADRIEKAVRILAAVLVDTAGDSTPVHVTDETISPERRIHAVGN